MSITRDGCQWSRDGDYDSETWATGCRHYFTIIDGAPAENHFKFCCYCGKPLVEVPCEDEPTDDAAQDRSA